MSKRSWKIVTFVSLVVVLGIGFTAWALHPRFLTREINRRLARIPGYNGEIAEAKIHLLTGRLSIREFRLDKNEEQAPAAFISVENILVNFSWDQLLRGRFVGSVELTKPKTLFLMRQRKPDQPRKFALWQPFLARFRPFRINRLIIHNGSLRLRNNEDIPPADLFWDQINVEGTNLTNRRRLLLRKPTRVAGTGRMMNEAPLALTVEAKPFQDHATFELTGKLDRFNLTRLNPVLRHYTGVDIEKGFMSVEGKFSVDNSSFTGQVHRESEEMDVLGKNEDHLGFIQRVKEFMFESWLNEKKDKQTGKLVADYDVAGPLGYMDQDIFLAAVWVSKTAFLQSLRPTLPPTVTMGTPEQAEEEWLALQAKQRAKIQKPRTGIKTN